MLQNPSSLALSLSNLRNSRAGYYAVAAAPRSHRKYRLESRPSRDRSAPSATTPRLSDSDRLIRRDWLDHHTPSVTRFHE